MPQKAAPQATSPERGLSLRDATAQILALATAPVDRESDADENAGPTEDDRQTAATVEHSTSAPEAESPAPDAPDEPPAPAEPDQPLVPVYRVKVDGKEIEVPEDELIRGYSRDADYRRKTMQVAAQRKEVEAEQARLAAEKAETARQRAEYAEAIRQLSDLTRAQEPPTPDWDQLQATNPQAFAVEWARYQQRKEVREALDAEARRVAELERRDRAERQKQMIAAEEQALLEAQPKWKDQRVRAADLAKVAAYARSKGYTQQQIDAITDHRVVLMLNKARLQEEAEARLADRRQRERPDTPEYARGFAAPRPAAPGQPGSQRPAVTPYDAARRRAAETGKPKDAAAAIQQLLAAEAANRR